MKTPNQHQEAIGAAIAALDAAVMDMGYDYRAADEAGKAAFRAAFRQLPADMSSNQTPHCNAWRDLETDTAQGTVREFLPTFFARLKSMF